VGGRLRSDFAQLVDNVLGRGAIGVAHAEVDDVLAARALRRLHRVDFGEDVGREAADAVEFVHGILFGGFCCAAKERWSAFRIAGELEARGNGECPERERRDEGDRGGREGGEADDVEQDEQCRG
jgi:hypothetical protein